MKVGRFFILIFCGVLGASGELFAAPARVPVRAKLKAKGHETKRNFIFSEKKGYSYEVKEKLTDIAVVRVFNSEGKALDGFYEISIEELHEMLGRNKPASVKP